jgi:hypothetical protein
MTPGIEVVAALTRVWQTIRACHPDVPPVVLLFGPSPSRPGAKRTTLGRFSTAGWWLREPPEDSIALGAAECAVEQAVEQGDLSATLSLNTELIRLHLAQLYRGLSSAHSEVFIATELATSAPTCSRSCCTKPHTQSRTAAASRTRVVKADITTHASD